MSTSAIHLEEARSYIHTMNLDYIIEYMCSVRYPFPRWTISDATHCCQLYKNLLLLFKKHHPEFLVPTREIDEFWHNHILYTKQYTHDCSRIFGYYLHHDPAFPSDEPSKLIQAFLKTKTYYLEEFKEPLDVMLRS